MLVATEFATRWLYRDVTTTADDRGYFAVRWARQAVRFNSHGFRDREFGPKPPGVFRIVALGDSFTFGNGGAVRPVPGLHDRLHQSSALYSLLGTWWIRRRLRGRRADVVQAIAWLHEYYASDRGRRRPNGLWLADRKQPDFEAIGAWIFDVYLNERVAGKTEQQARQAIEDAIRSSDEWRRVHAAS